MLYEEVANITQSIEFIILVIFIFLSTLGLYSLVGILSKASSSSGRYSKRFIQTTNFLWGFLLLFFWLGLTLLLIIFPIWAYLLPNYLIPIL